MPEVGAAQRCSRAAPGAEALVRRLGSADRRSRCSSWSATARRDRSGSNGARGRRLSPSPGLARDAPHSEPPLGIQNLDSVAAAETGSRRATTARAEYWTKVLDGFVIRSARPPFVGPGREAGRFNRSSRFSRDNRQFMSVDVSGFQHGSRITR